MEGRAFQQIGALKAAFLLHLLQKGHRVLVSDVDTAGAVQVGNVY
jgi:hypothetical protein